MTTELPLPPPPPQAGVPPVLEPDPAGEGTGDVVETWACVDCDDEHAGGCREHVPVRDDDGRCTGAYYACTWIALPGTNVCARHRVETQQMSYRMRARLETLVPTALDELERVLFARSATDADKIRAAITVLDRTNETSKVSRQEISGPEGGPVEVADTRGRDLHELIANDPHKARRLDRTARDLYVVPDPDRDEDAG